MSVLGALKCLVGFHDRVYDRAEDRESGGYKRLHPHHDDREPEPVDACYIVQQCVRCGSERRLYASVDTAERLGVPFAWDSTGGGGE